MKNIIIKVLLTIIWSLPFLLYNSDLERISKVVQTLLKTHQSFYNLVLMFIIFWGIWGLGVKKDNKYK